MASLSGPAGTGGMLFIWVMAFVAVETMSTNPVMISCSAVSHVCVQSLLSRGVAYREGTLADDDQRAIDNSDALSRRLKGLALLSDDLEVVDNLSGRQLREDRGADGQGRGEDGAEGNHGDCLVEWFGCWERSSCLCC